MRGADAPVVVSLRRDQSADSDGRWMTQDNAVAIDAVVELINTALCAELRAAAQCIAYIFLCRQCPLAL